MSWLLKCIIKLLYVMVRNKNQVSDKPINITYHWEICNSCKTQLNDNIIRYDDNSFCKSCYDEIDMNDAFIF